MANIESMVASMPICGSVTIGTSGAAISATSLRSRFGWRLKAASGNSGTITVGSTAAPGTGYPLAAGETMELKVEDLANIFIVGSAASQVLKYAGEGPTSIPGPTSS